MNTILDSKPQRIGVPLFFAMDLFAIASHVDAYRSRALESYLTAEGYTYEWGHIIEECRYAVALQPIKIWHIVPLAFWYRIAHCTAAINLANELTRALDDGVRDHLRDELPDWLMLGGCQSTSRRRPHALFSIVCHSTEREHDARIWIGEIFLPLLFPRLIHRLEEIAMNCIAQTVGGSPDAALQNRLICESRLQQVA